MAVIRRTKPTLEKLIINAVDKGKLELAMALEIAHYHFEGLTVSDKDFYRRNAERKWWIKEREKANLEMATRTGLRDN